MIDKKQWERFIHLRNEMHAHQQDIELHMTDVIKEICAIFGDKYDTWFYPNAEEGEMGIMRIYDDSISIEMQVKGWSYREYYYKDYNLFEVFPIEFLYMSVEDVSKEIQNFLFEKNKAKEEKKLKKQKRRIKSQMKKEKLKANAISKLSPEEIKALGIK